MKPGPKPLPLAVVKFNGNPSNKPISNGDIPDPKAGAPDMPDWLDGEAKAEWKRLAEPLVKLGVLSKLDAQPFESLCFSWSEWRKYAKLAMKGTGRAINGRAGNDPGPSYTKMARDYQKDLKALWAYFGLTPADRMHMVLPSGAGDDDDTM
ncbi:MAG: phage terminase small subunit P27 family [Proteobacteria bacterium]|nr:phage terminase small subunit P27 family [Pseudomonadota bacterium]